jgi:hypothetical protein
MGAVADLLLLCQHNKKKSRTMSAIADIPESRR